MANSPPVSNPQCYGSVAPPSPVTRSTNQTVELVKKLPTKKDSLKQARENLGQMMGKFRRISCEKGPDESIKQEGSLARQVESAARGKESRERSAFQAKQNVLVDITLLKE